jgi:putative two-component system response regulator
LVAENLGMTPREVEIIRHAAPMHDVGKIGIPDSILLKPGSLSSEEWEVMRQHTVIGAEILKGSPSEILQAGAEIALTHHEKWDGSGYPQGLTGEEIPLAGRICAVVDVFDALTSARRYRSRGALPNQEVYEMMEESRGSHFDPRVLDAFLARREEIEQIQETHREFPPSERTNP